MTRHPSIDPPVRSGMLAVFGITASLLVAASGAEARPRPLVIRVVDAVCPLPPNGARTAEGGFTVVNPGPPDRLVGLSSPAAANVTLHVMSMVGGIMRMTPIAGGVPIPHGVTKIDAVGRHAMFVGLKAPFRLGTRVPMTLIFARAGRVLTACEVRPRD